MASLKAILFGMTVAAAIGPIALLIISVSANAGLGAGLRSATGAATADLSYAFVALTAGHRLTPLIEGSETGLKVGASLVLLSLGIWMIQTALRQIRPPDVATRKCLLKRPFFQTYALTAANPLTLVLFAGFTMQLPLAESLAQVCWFSAMVAVGSLLVQVPMVVGGSILGSVLGRGHRIVALNVISGMGVSLFGIVGLYQWVAP